MDSEIAASAWTDALELTQPHATRGFLALGGDSLRAMQLCAVLSEQLGVEVNVRDVLESRSMAEFSERLAALAPASASASARAARHPAPQEQDGEALSFSQERMFVLHELAAGSAAYHVPMAWRLQGKLDVAALRQAFALTVANHHVLGITLVSDSGQLAPLHGRPRPPELEEVQLIAGPDEDPLRALDDFISEYANSAFQLEKGPLLRATLVHLAPDDAVLVVVMHHIVGDQWALDVFFRGLAAAYTALRQGEAHDPASPTLSFARYAAAHRSWFLRERQAVELAYWRERLRGLEPTVLNEDFVRPPQQSFRGARLRLDFNPREILALRQFGAARGATLAMVLLTALKILLMRHTGRSNIAVGVPVANRQHPATHDLMGTLVNTVVVRTELSPQEDFTAALGEVRESLLGALDHQDLPFEMLVRELQLERDPGRPPLFSVMFNMLNTPLGEVSLPDLKWSRRDIDRRASQFDLTVTVDAEYARSINFEYSTVLFSADTIGRLADHFMALLRAALQEPERAIGTISLISEAERSQLKEWAQGPRRARATVTIDAMIDAQIARSGNSPAVCFGEQTLSYSQLGAESTAVTDALIRMGIGPGDLVGLHLQRTPRVITTLLGVLRSGAAYVPLDPAFPAERLAFMAHDAKLRLLLTDAPPDITLQWPEDCQCLRLDELRTVAAEGSPAVRGTPRLADPAYVLYTSGSTGRPKGVVVPHTAVTNFLQSMREEPGIDAADRLLAITTPSFDIAVLELLLPLTVGARIVLASRAEQTDGELLQALLLRHDATIMQATPSTWRLLIDSGWNGSGRLRALVGGEPLSRELAGQLLARCTEVWNMYGPTETTVWSSCGRVEPQGRDRISLGRPIANTVILVLDANREICPVGVAGEICIGGDGVALGYLNRPALTAERFIANPHSTDRRAGRLYLTGDRGRWRQDGQLEHLGRLDSQVKLRGYRIELGEIESRLLAHPQIQSAVVLASSRGASEPTLQSWIVPRGQPPDARELREFVRQWLPEFMVPQHFIPVQALPLLPNGKLDRQALPLPQGGTMGREPPVPPRTPMQRTLWVIWREMLGHSAFGIHDNLFEVGGHSLLAVRMTSRIRDQLQRSCNLALLFRNPTIARLEAALSQTEPLPGSTLVPLQTVGDGPEVFCLCGIMIYRELAEALAPEFPVCAVFVPKEMGFLAKDAPRDAPGPDVRDLAREYLDAIRSRQPRGPYRLLGFSFGGLLAYEVAQQLTAQGESVSFLAVLDCDVPGIETTWWLRRLWRLWRDSRWMLGKKLWHAGDPLAAMRDARYLDAIRHYQARPWNGEAWCVFSADTPPSAPGKGWEQLISGLHTQRINDGHLDILKNNSVRKVAAFLRTGLGQNR